MGTLRMITASIKMRTYLSIAIIIILTSILYSQYRTNLYIWLISEQIDNGLSEQQKVNYIRNYVHSHTTHLVLNRDPRNVKDQYNLLRGMYQGQKVPTTCGPSAEAMRLLLGYWGIKTRLVHSFSGQQNVILSHTYLEAYVNGEWQLHDPYYNIYYTLDNGGYASAMDVLVDKASVYDGFTERTMTDGDFFIFLRDIYEVLMYDNREANEPPIIVINTTKFDTGKVFSGNGNEPFVKGKTFKEFATEIYGKIIWREI